MVRKTYFRIPGQFLFKKQKDFFEKKIVKKFNKVMNILKREQPNDYRM